MLGEILGHLLARRDREQVQVLDTTDFGRGDAEPVQLAAVERHAVVRVAHRDAQLLVLDGAQRVPRAGLERAAPVRVVVGGGGGAAVALQQRQPFCSRRLHPSPSGPRRVDCPTKSFYASPEFATRGEPMTTTGPAPHPEVADAVAKLAAVLGDAHVLTGEADRRWYAADFTDAEVPTPVAVAQPSCTEDVVEVVKIARGAGLAVVPRGGGMSYTLAHTPARAETLVVDLRRMDRIVECNLADRYVTVEAGVTWAQLMDRLRGTGHWLTFNGTLSGLHATVGGTLAQNSSGLGRGWLSEAVLGLEVVLGDGRVLQTGSGAAEGTAPYYRNFGPDLSGLFLCDSGAFGFKTRATLRLDPVPGGTAFGCYAFDDRAADDRRRARNGAHGPDLRMHRRGQLHEHGHGRDAAATARGDGGGREGVPRAVVEQGARAAARSHVRHARAA